MRNVTMKDNLIIKGAREHNLKNIDVIFPRNQFIVVTGLSGSGKSSLAFDTIYAEGQRRYVESLSSYARQFLGQMEKPDVDYIEGLSPAISIEQKTTSRNPRSTVGTITEIYDYLRLLYARCGVPHCPICGKEMTSQSIDQILDEILKFKERTKIQVLAPIVQGRKGEYRKELENIQKDGFVRVRINGEIKELEDKINLDKNKKHNIDILIDRLVIKEGIRERLADSVETALRYTDGVVTILYKEPDAKKESEKIFSEKLACIPCGFSMEELHPRFFSFNSPQGACEECHGLGEKKEFDIQKIAPDFSLSINEGALKSHKNLDGWNLRIYEALSKELKFSLDTPLEKLPKKIIDTIFYGTNRTLMIKYRSKDGESHGQWKHNYEGIIPTMERRFRETSSDQMKQWYESFMKESKCPKCKGYRLKEESLSVKIENTNIIEITDMSVEKALKFFTDLELEGNKREIADKILKEIRSRLSFLHNVGLSYITLSRKAGTLSGGEAQRIRLATQIGSQLVGVLYVLDEPSIGLHQRDNQKLIDTLIHLRNLGNTLIVVEHDEQTILSSDHVIDLGPGAGVHGGHIVAEGTPEDILKNKNSLTGKYMSGKLNINIPKKLTEGNGEYIEIINASLNNLKKVNAKIPLGKFICVTGVSGSGKSSLINQILYKALREKKYKANMKEYGYSEIKGYKNIDKMINIDQSPIGRTPRSNPATYTNLFTPIREIFSTLPESKMKGYAPGRFSFNVKGGRCESCKGDGKIKIEMHFLPDIYVTCEVCKGKRYNKETLEVKYKGKNIADVLDMTVEEALEFFENIPKVKRRLKTLNDVGLGYIKLGQSATTLSGGEAQRVKLATELSKRSTGQTLYLLDEPTTGLHFDDVKKLVTVLRKLVKKGNTVLVIEHNLDVIKIADHIIDLGPEGGDGGGTIIGEGTPYDIMKNKKSYTGKYLKDVFEKEGIKI